MKTGSQKNDTGSHFPLDNPDTVSYPVGHSSSGKGQQGRKRPKGDPGTDATGRTRFLFQAGDMESNFRDVSDQELAVLHVLWDRGPATIRQVTDVLYPDGTDANYASVQKFLERL